MRRFNRLLRLLGLLQGHRRLNVKDIAEELEVHERTVHRDLEVLELAGVPWVFDRSRKSYRIEHWYNFPALPLTHDDLLDQAAAAAIAATPGVSAGGGAKAVTERLAGNAPERAAQLLADAQRALEVLDLKLAGQQRHREHLRTIQWALIGRKQLAARYDSPYQSHSPAQGGQSPFAARTPQKGTVPKAVLHPYRLLLTRQAWYLIARPADAGNPRVYRVARFAALRPLDRPADVPADFDLRAYLGNAWSVFRGDETFEIELLFHQDAARIVAETTWHHTQQVQRHPDGTATVKFRIDGLDEIIWWLLGWAGFVAVVRPERLREMFVEQLRAGFVQNERQL